MYVCYLCLIGTAHATDIKLRAVSFFPGWLIIWLFSIQRLLDTPTQALGWHLNTAISSPTLVFHRSYNADHRNVSVDHKWSSELLTRAEMRDMDRFWTRISGSGSEFHVREDTLNANDVISYSLDSSKPAEGASPYTVDE